MGSFSKGWWSGLLLLVVGCGTNWGDPELVPVYGKVLFQGQPLAGGTIVCAPDPERGGRGPLGVATIDSEGRFIMHSGGKPGVVPGWHRITVTGPPHPYDSTAASLPSRYADPERSGLARQIQPGKANTLDLTLE